MTETPQAMTYHEREKLKQFASKCRSDGDTESATEMLTLIAHWMRQRDPVPFEDYAANWIESQRNRTDGIVLGTERMATAYPLTGDRPQSTIAIRSKRP